MRYSNSYNDFIDLGSLVNSVTSGIDTFTDAGIAARQEALRAQTLQAQAQVEQARALQLAAGKKSNMVAITGIAVAGLVVTIGLIALIKSRQKKA